MTKKDLYYQWNTKTLGGSTKLSVDNFDLIQDGIHVEAPNEPSLELVNLVGQATNTQSQSGPMPGTGQITTTAFNEENTTKTVFQPEAGTVYAVNAASVKWDSAGSANADMFVTHEGNTSMRIATEGSGGASTDWQNFDSAGQVQFPFYVTNETYLQVESRNTGAGDNFTVYIYSYRVR